MNLQQQLANAELKGIAIGAALGAAVMGIWVLIQLESQNPPAFACPPGVEIVIGDRVLVHSPDSPETRYCAIPMRP